MISRVNLADTDEYQELNIGDTVTVYGNSIHLGEVVSVEERKLESNMAHRLKAALLQATILFAIYACNFSEKENQTTASTIRKAPTKTKAINTVNLCFRQVTGWQNQDTAWIVLHINGQQVTGSYVNLPFEKDVRRGTLRGTKKEKEISALWSFMQEGQLDSLPVQFKLTNNQLRQKPFSYNKDTGRKYLADTTSYSVIFQETNCADLPESDI